MSAPPLASAFDAVLRQIDRAERTELRTAGGESAAEHLARLRSEVERERGRAVDRGGADPEWLRATVRWVAEWTPDSEVGLIAALGQLARASAPSAG